MNNLQKINKWNIWILLISVSLSGCKTKSDSGKDHGFRNNYFADKSFQDTLDKKVSIDTNSIVYNIKTNYNFIIKNKTKAKVETSESHENHKDSEADGEYSERNLYDTTFVINDSLSFHKSVIQEDNHIRSYNCIMERFYINNRIFFEFSQSCEYLYFQQKSTVNENRSYYFNNSIIRCLERNSTFDGNIEFDNAIDSLSKKISNNCLKKK